MATRSLHSAANLNATHKKKTHAQLRAIIIQQPTHKTFVTPSPPKKHQQHTQTRKTETRCAAMEGHLGLSLFRPLEHGCSLARGETLQHDSLCRRPCAHHHLPSGPSRARMAVLRIDRVTRACSLFVPVRCVVHRDVFYLLLLPLGLLDGGVLFFVATHDHHHTIDKCHLSHSHAGSPSTQPVVARAFVRWIVPHVFHR